MTKVWWVGWEFPDRLRTDKRIAALWPDGVEGWTTGYAQDYTTWVGRVEAPSAHEAQALVKSIYGDLADQVVWRWVPDEKPAGWSPGNDRVPRKK